MAKERITRYPALTFINQYYNELSQLGSPMRLVLGPHKERTLIAYNPDQPFDSSQIVCTGSYEELCSAATVFMLDQYRLYVSKLTNQKAVIDSPVQPSTNEALQVAVDGLAKQLAIVIEERDNAREALHELTYEG